MANRVNVTAFEATLIFPFDNATLCRYVSVEMLINAGVEPELREKFWCKYGAEVQMPVDSVGYMIQDCTVLSDILESLSKRTKTRRYQSGVLPVPQNIQNIP